MALWTSVDEAAGKPKNLTTTEKDSVYGVSVAEAGTAAAQSKGLNTPGWVKYTTYEDSEGNTRHKSEVLVAFATITGDGEDDAILPDVTLTITTQPADLTVTAPDAAEFSVVATASSGTALYQWQLDSGSGFADIDGETTDTLTIADSTGLDANAYRVVVSVADAASLTSDAATLTVE
jgi:hypothetical protein